MTTLPLGDIIRPGVTRGLDYVILEELRKRSGIQVQGVLKWAMSEMLCNSLDTDATAITIKVTTIGDFDKITVTDNGSTKLTINDVKLILEFANKASSKRGLLRVTRGTHGNALKCLFGYNYALAKAAGLTPPIAQISSHGEMYTIRIAPNRVSQEIEHEITVARALTDQNSFTFRFPVNRSSSRLHSIENRDTPSIEARMLRDLIHATGIVNPERRITYDLWSIHVGTMGKAGDAVNLGKDTSVLWYEPSEFTELLYDFARARPKTQLKEFLSLFRGFTAKKSIREILQILSDSPNHDSQTEKMHYFPTTLIRDLSPSDVEKLYYVLQTKAKPVSKRRIANVLGCVGEVQFEALMVREGWMGLKYKLIKDRVEPLKGSFGEPLSHATYPFLIELAVFDRAPNDTEGPKVYRCVNFMASNETLFSRIFNINLRLGQIGITQETPITIVIHLVCPVLRYLNYAKTTVGGDHIGKLMKKAFDKLLPIPKQPRRYKRKTPRNPVSWFPRGTFENKSYRWRLRAFAKTMQALDSQRGSILSKVSARGWGYILEGLGKINKGEFNALAKSINDCIKLGYLPIDFTAEDQDPTRRFTGIHTASNPPTLLRGLQENMDMVLDALPHHTTEYWQDEEYYLMMLVEKIDIYNLFTPICKEYNIPISNSKGWYTLKARYQIAKLSQRAIARGQKPVLLLFFDHDISGLKISQTIRKGLQDMTGATKWDPSGLIIDRFGLNFDDIEENSLTWIPNLKSGSGKSPNPKHKDVKEYVSLYGERKCEANALLKDEESLTIGQELCRNAIEKYYGADVLGRFKKKRESSKKKLNKIYENPVWSDVRVSLMDLIEGYPVEITEQVAALETEKEYIVKIYQKIDNEHYHWGQCPVCETSFDYNRSIINAMVRCRTCNIPMRLIEAPEDSSNG